MKFMVKSSTFIGRGQDYGIAPPIVLPVTCRPRLAYGFFNFRHDRAAGEQRTMMDAIQNSEMDVQDTLHACDPQELPWVPWAMKGAQFKLLSADAETGRFSLLIRLEKGCVAPMHRHIGAVEGFIMEGGFHYADKPAVRFAAGTYLLEKDGAVHQPVSPEGAVMFAVFHGPVEGLDPHGTITGRIDCAWHIETWKAAISTQPT